MVNIGGVPMKKKSSGGDPDRFKHKVVINQQAYFTDSIKINQVNSNVIIQNRQKADSRELEARQKFAQPARPITQLGMQNLTQLVNKMANT